MTIAQLFRSMVLEDVPFDNPSMKLRCIIKIQQSPYFKEEGGDVGTYYDCLNLIPGNILAAANHNWAVELLYCSQMKPVEALWFSSLLNNYRRKVSVGLVYMAMDIIVKNPCSFMLFLKRTEEKLTLLMNTYHSVLESIIYQHTMFCQGNNCSLEMTFLKGEFDVSYKMEKEEKSEDECLVCLEPNAVYRCGNTSSVSCTAKLCANCFVHWFMKNPKCPQCRQEYIPLRLQQ